MIAGGPRYVSSQFIAEDNGFEIDGYLTWDAGVFYDLDNWRFRVNLKNITDQDYETRGFGAFSVLPADPFAVYAGVDFKL
jgi:iron complex outermembrane receptor protein